MDKERTEEGRDLREVEKRREKVKRESTVGAKIKFMFRFRTTVVLRYEMPRSVFTDSSVLYVTMIADSAIIGFECNK